MLLPAFLQVVASDVSLLIIKPDSTVGELLPILAIGLDLLAGHELLITYNMHSTFLLELLWWTDIVLSNLGIVC